MKINTKKLKEIDAMSFKELITYMAKNSSPKQYMTFRLSILPTAITKIIELSKKEGRTDKRILKDINDLAISYEKSLEKTGFSI